MAVSACQNSPMDYFDTSFCSLLQPSFGKAKTLEVSFADFRHIKTLFAVFSHVCKLNIEISDMQM